MAYNDRWESEVVICGGGLDVSTDALTQGTAGSGTARILQNYESALEGGYRRISGFSKYDTATVPGDTNAPILGVKAALGGVFAVRYITGSTDNAIYYSSAGGWGTKINTATRPGGVVKARIISYSISEPVIVVCDGVNRALKYNGTSDTLINGTGAPTNPKYAEVIFSRLVLAGYSANVSAISISAPNADTDFTAGAGAIELSVGDEIVGLKTFREVLYIFCKRSIWALTGNSADTFAIKPIAKSIGCLSGDSIQEVGGDLVFLAPDGLRSIAATEKIGDIDLGLLSRNIQPILRPLISGKSDYLYSSCAIRSKSQYRMFINDSSVERTDAFGVIGKLSANANGSGYAWSTLRGISAYCADSEYVDNQEIAVFGDVTTGYVYRQEQGNDFDGTNIIAVYCSPQLTFKDASLRKVMQKATIYTETEGNSDIELSVLLDFQESTVLQPAAITLNQTGTFPEYGVAVYDTDVYGSLQLPVFKQNLIGSCFTAAFCYTSVGGAAYRIDSYQIQYAQKGKR